MVDSTSAGNGQAKGVPKRFQSIELTISGRVWVVGWADHVGLRVQGIFFFDPRSRFQQESFFYKLISLGS